MSSTASAGASASSANPATSATSRATGGGSRNLVFGLLGLALALGLVVFLLGDRSDPGDIVLGADNARPRGAKALRVLLDELDHDVTVTDTVPGGESDVVVAFEFGLTGAQGNDLEDFVRRGGRVVVVGVLGPLAADQEETFSEPDGLVEAERCDIAPLDGIETIRVAPEDSFTRITRFTRLAGDQVCLGDDQSAVVLARPLDDGVVVSVGAGEIFTNRSLGDADNAELAVGLIAPQVRTNITILVPDTDAGGQAGGQLGAGDQGVFDLIPGRVTLMFWLLGAAVVIYIAHHGRRLGRVVNEPLPANIEGSELVVALGNLRERAQRPYVAADILRENLRRDLATSVGLDPAMPPDVAVGVLAQRTAVDPEDLASVLIPRAIEDDAALLAYSARIDRVLKTANHQQSGPGPAEESTIS